ncbi:MAG TPA: SDR family NAD(P)-dependent oxidoreductase [Bradyrhizobium sp.]|nr:SDR family NAD(P)-dependent oxidoreductase [Bradyrhizobium sp.]
MNKGLAVVTGAAGGVGRDYAEGLAKRGYDLLLVGREQNEITQIARRIADETGRQVGVAVHDLSDPKNLAELEARLERDESVTLLANIAGAATFGPFSGITTAHIDQTIAVNVTALTRLNRAVAPGFAKRGKGIIVNFASVLAFHPWPEFNVYDAAKAFVVSLSQALQGELRGKGVLVQVVSPPATATRFWETAGLPYDRLPPGAVMKPEDLVRAALIGLDRGEEWVMPSLADAKLWDGFQKARGDLVNGMMSGQLAERYSALERASAANA